LGIVSSDFSWQTQALFGGLILGGIMLWPGARRGCRRVFLALGAVSLLACGIWNTTWQRALPEDEISRLIVPGNYFLEGIISAPPERTPRKTTILLSAERIWRKNQPPSRTKGKVRLNIYQQPPPKLRYGDRLRLYAKLYPPTNFKNPGSFDYRRYLARRGIHLVGYAKTKSRPLVKLGRAGNPYLALIFDLRRRLSRFIDQLSSASSTRLLKSILLGERKSLTKKQREDFSRAGLAHLLAISGLHLGLVSLFVFLLLRTGLEHLPQPLLERLTAFARPVTIAAAASLPVIWGYTVLTGARTPTIRAAIMFSAYLLGILLDRQHRHYNTLALAALVILAWQPEAVYEADFQLSFTAVFFIIYTLESLPPAAPLERYFTPSWPQRLRRWLREYFLITLAAYLAVAPLVLWHFQRVSSYGVLANLLAVPLAWGTILLGLFGGFFLFFWSPLAVLVLRLALWGAACLEGLAGALAGLPGASFWLPRPSGFALLLSYGALAFLWRSRRWSLRALWGGLFLAALLLRPPASSPQRILRVDFLDVGQGDAIVLRLPQGQTMLIDGGGMEHGGLDMGEAVVIPYFLHQGISRIERVILSHPHPDHYGGLLEVVEYFPVREFWEPPVLCQAGGYRRLKELLAARGVLVRQVGAGVVERLGEGVLLEVLNPPWRSLLERRMTDRELNNASLVLRLTYGRISFLFTGDIEAEAEGWLLRSGRNIRATVLKVPHHGALTSSTPEFLDAVAPEMAIFTTPAPHFFWHPRPRLYRRYTDRGITILRTDARGLISLFSDGEKYWVESYVAEN